MDSGSSDDGEDYVYGEADAMASRKYPVHDCCEFEDADSLRKLIFVPQSDDESDDEEEPGEKPAVNKNGSAGSSSSDDNDSAAAAHAAAIGHSPQLNPSSKIAAEANDGDKTTEMDIEEAESANATGEEAEAQQPKPKKVTYFCPHNINERDDDENTPLHVAIHTRKLEHIKLLLQAGASVYKKCDGSPPIHTAISIGSVAKHAQFAYEATVVLTENGADLSSKDDAMHTPLYLACMYNLPQIASYILSSESGQATLNSKADRSGGRALHAAAKFDTAANLKFSNSAAAAVTGHGKMAAVSHHHPDGTVPTSMHHIPGFPGKQLDVTAPSPEASEHTASAQALLTQVLLEQSEIEIDVTNTVGQTALHIACGRGNWSVVRLLLQAGANPSIADRRGFSPGQHAHKRGMPIPNDLLSVLGDPPSSGTVAPPRDLIVDPDGNTCIITHELCVLHKTCPPIRRDAHAEPPPENVRRLTVLIDEEIGILRSGEFNSCVWQNETRRAAIVDVLKCHDYKYVERISQMCATIPDHPAAIAHLDADTAISRWSFEAALRAAGSVCEAVDKVVNGEFRNAFCGVRPPGHHAGPRGIVRCDNDPEGGSHGFCLLNNVAIGAAYARSMYRNEGIRKIAIIDFDVHHGNGTEEIIRQLVPIVEKTVINTPFAVGEFSAASYRPWLDETDVDNVFFASTHGYGPRGLEFADAPQGGWFYPASGKSHVSDAVKNPSLVETPNLVDFIASQAWTRIGEDARANCCKIINCGLGLPDRDAVPGMQRLEVRDTYRNRILPALREFDPDLIFISAGFDAHKKDTMNFGYVGMVEDDYEWVTEQIVRIANTCCNGRVISVLEGGYKIHGGIVSPFARSVASHVRALTDGGKSRELYDHQDGEWESQFERHLIDERERKRQQKQEKLRMAQAQAQLADSANGDGGEEGGSRKRRRNQVDYKELYEQMKKEGFAG